jgi:acyl dehydratase
MNLEALKAHRFEPKRVKYTWKDTALYNFSVGGGADPLDEKELTFVYEKKLTALPTIAAVLAQPGAWIADPKFEVNFLKLLHGEQTLEVHNPIPPEGEIEGSYAVQAVVDKGKDKGALVVFEKKLTDVASNQQLCTVTSTLFLRADGGCGNYGTPPAPQPTPPTKEFAPIGEVKTGERWALLYRLNGDLNPIHIDPTAGKKAGFERPILHGLCTYGVVGYILTRTFCDYDTSRLQSLNVRFSSPVYPGETIRVEGVRDGGNVYFQAVVTERNQVVLSNGLARIR